LPSNLLPSEKKEKKKKGGGKRREVERRRESVFANLVPLERGRGKENESPNIRMLMVHFSREKKEEGEKGRGRKVGPALYSQTLLLH